MYLHSPGADFLPHICLSDDIFDTSVSAQFDAVPIGVIYLKSTPVRRICNTLLLKSNWSLGPGHCVALMSHPDMSHLLLDWRLKYRYNNVPNMNYEKLYGDVNKDNLMIVTWQPGAPLFEDWSNTVGAFPVKILSQKDCKIEMAPIVDIRSYETCAVFEKAIYTSVEHGSLALHMDSFDVFGLVTWGEKLYRTYPLVILNVTYFKEWLDVAMAT
ncbi:unnamed protein product [Danaus chrysippus]|uniref:(African queen) hypothetical protein n=1 Tax=Danaus chrysippus TaxID=151541 RepID=A0A8J2MX87_9NEOP|nr:unnamed protein product [Danaus chrysippus]